MLPSMTLSKVDGMPNGLKLSAVGPILALGSKTVPSKAVGLQLGKYPQNGWSWLQLP